MYLTAAVGPPKYVSIVRRNVEQENHSIAKMTVRYAQYMRPIYVNALKIVGPCKRKISRRLHKNLHLTILSLFGGAVKLPVRIL